MDKLWRWIAGILPKNLVKWCFLRVFAYGTQGKYGSTVVPEVTCLETLDRWNR